MASTRGAVIDGEARQDRSGADRGHGTRSNAGSRWHDQIGMSIELFDMRPDDALDSEYRAASSFRFGWHAGR